MSISVKVDFNDQYKKLMGSDFEKMLDKSLTRSIVEAETICIREAPVKTGTLRRSIGHSHPCFLRVDLTGVKYWRYVQFGTAPHIITPRGNGLLVWKDDSGTHAAKKVNHPGTKANPFITRTLKKIQSQKILDKNFLDVLKMEGIIG